MRNRYPILALLFALALFAVAGWAQKEASPKKGSALPSAEALGTSLAEQAPAEPAQEMKDQMIGYRFRLGQTESDLALVVTNATDREGLLAVVVFEAPGRVRTEMRGAVGPGESVLISPADARWALSEQVSVKASRRLQLTLRENGQTEGIVIRSRPNAAVYDIFSLERNSELSRSEASRLVEMLGVDQPAVRKVTADANLFEALWELHSMARSQRFRGLFIAYKAK